MILFYLILTLLPPTGPEEPKEVLKGQPQRIILQPKTSGPYYIGGHEVLGTVIDDDENFIYDENGQFLGERTWKIYKIERSEVGPNGITFWIYIGTISEETTYDRHCGAYMSEIEGNIDLYRQEFFWWTKERKGVALTIQKAIREMLK